LPNYRRMVRPGGTFFFTVVTARRSPLFADDRARSILGECLRDERISRPFVVEAIVLLPDHLHAMWTLPEADTDFSTRWSWIKAQFTRRWLSGGGRESAVLPGQARKRQRGVWQARFHEHTVRDEDDFLRLADYIHFNPVKHGLAAHPGEWPWSSFHRHVKKGFDPPEWAHPQDTTWAGLDESLLE
jgi:putative transposase